MAGLTYVADEVKLGVAKVVQDAILATSPQLEQSGYPADSVSIDPAIASTTIIRIRMPDGKHRVFVVKFSESY